MTSYNSRVKHCPHCTSKLEVQYCVSCNTFNAKYYTDGFVEGSMYDETSLLLVCPDCREYFWLEDGIDKVTGDGSNETPVSIRSAECVRGSEYEDALRREVWANEAQEKYVRIRAWWSFNSRYRDRTAWEFQLSSEQENNLKRLLQLLDETKPTQSLMKAELYRELGLFEECLSQLNVEFDDQYSLAVDTIRECASSEKRQVEQISQTQQANNGATGASSSIPVTSNLEALHEGFLQEFEYLICKRGEPFGQKNQPAFGMSDGSKGAQWNIVIDTEKQLVRLGVNLEGLKYSRWPIATFIQSEINNPCMTLLKKGVREPEMIFIQFRRDAWQVRARPEIEEQLLGKGVIPIAEMDDELWIATLTEALGCLDETKGYRGRAKQVVTLKNHPKDGGKQQLMWVSPHLNIWTPVEWKRGNVSDNIRKAQMRLINIHLWVSLVSAGLPMFGYDDVARCALT